MRTHSCLDDNITHCYYITVLPNIYFYSLSFARPEEASTTYICSHGWIAEASGCKHAVHGSESWGDTLRDRSARQQRPMTIGEIHTLGIRVVAVELREEGFVIVNANADPEASPQIVARRDGQLHFVAVRTDAYPGRGFLDSSSYLGLVGHAVEEDAFACLASLGIRNLHGITEEEKATPVRGGAMSVDYFGICCLASPAHARVAGFLEEASPAMLGACNSFALMLNTMEMSHIEPLLAANVSYSSDWTAESVDGRTDFLAYFDRTFEKIKFEGSKIWAEVAYTNAFRTTSCVIGAVSKKRRVDMTTLIDMDPEGKIVGVRTGWHPAPYTCLRTGGLSEKN